jgi:leucyl aminopeptidase
MAMRVRVTSVDASELEADLAACFAFEGDREPRGVSNARLRRELAEQMTAETFRGQSGDRLVWNTNGRFGSRRFLVLGLGQERETPGEAIRIGAARAARAAAAFHSKSLALRLPPAPDGRSAVEARAAVEGAFLGSYRFDRHLTDPDRKQVPLERLEIAVDGAARALRDAARLGEVTGEAITMARDLVNEGPSRKTPSTLARFAASVARKSKIRCTVKDVAALRRERMHALLAVARGSASPPRVVHLAYRPAGKRARRRVVLVGKGVTFDSGGLNLKPAPSMRAMKTDMAGAAAVLAVMGALPAIGCRSEVHGLLGLVENMTGGDAYKPGDILETRSGKTVEVDNTDAEGRLVLCDLLDYAADRIEPTHVVDVATLTGACVVALGELAAGLFGRGGELRDELLDASAAAGEKLWPMPLYEEYLQLLQRGPADLANSGGRWGGAITAALFLGEFLPRDLPWAHLDIAGPAFAESEQLAVGTAGATGASVSTLLRWLGAR